MNNDSQGVFTRERLLTIVLAILTFLALYICYLIVQPFVPAMAFALALAVATQRPYRWLCRKLKRNTLSAGLAVALVALLIIGPAAALTTYIVQMATEHIGELRKGGNVGEIRQKLEQQPMVGPLIKQVGERFKVEEQIGNIGQAVASRATGFLSGSVSALTQLVITLFVLFFLYRDTGESVAALRTLLPLSEAETGRMFERVASTIEATVNGSLTVALIQAVLAGVVYLILGVPLAILWAAVTFLMALVPVLGTFLVWAPIALYLAFSGSLGKAVFLAIWGGLIVSSVDNILYPYLVGDKLRLHTVPTFFSILGGIALFGPAGLILGPMSLAIAIALMDVWWLRTEGGQAAEKEVADVSHADTPAPAAVLQNPHEL
ncbi:MAG TPA: AI-2E family transporter [Bryobacteraceae bacterium]|nr:AI-2E family transporter [Bryobacteraceae bacterium]